MKDVELFEQQLGEKSKLAILVGGLSSHNPKNVIDNATAKYVGNTPHNQFVDIKLDNPWTRVIISGINTLPFHDYDTYMKTKDKGYCQCKQCRKRKLERINGTKSR